MYSTYLTVPSAVAGTDKTTGIAPWDCSFKTAMLRYISTSLLGALTEAQPRYVTPWNTTQSPVGVVGRDIEAAPDASLPEIKLKLYIYIHNVKNQKNAVKVA